MANDNQNILPTPQVDNPVDEIIQDVTSQETEQVLEPSITKRQTETTEAQPPKRGEKFKAAQAKREKVRRATQGIESEAQKIADMRQKDQQQEEKNIRKQKENDLKSNTVQANIDKIQADVDYAKQRGLPSAALEAQIQNLEAEKKELVGTQEVQVQEQPEAERAIAAEPQKIDMEPSKAEVFEQAKELKNERTSLQAQQVVVADEIEEQRKIVNSAMKTMREEDLSITKIDNNRFWNNTSTWQKIGMGLAMIFGGGQGGNKAVQVVQNFINQDIEAQKLDNKTKLAKREEAFRRVNLELTRMQSLTTNDFKKQQIEIAKQKLAAEQVKANRERLQKAQALIMKDFVLKKGVKLENLTPTQINAIFDPEDFKVAKGLRDEYNKQTTKLGTREVVNAFGDIQALSNKEKATGPTDIFLLTKAMKFIDPNSVVREGEFHIAETASPPIRMVNRYANKILHGTRLTAADRKEFKENAALLFKVKLRNQDRINKKYRSLSKQHGLPSSLVVEDFSLATISPREALVEKKAKQFKGISRQKIENNIDKLIEAGKLSENFRN